MPKQRKPVVEDVMKDIFAEIGLENLVAFSNERDEIEGKAEAELLKAYEELTKKYKIEKVTPDDLLESYKRYKP